MAQVLLICQRPGTLDINTCIRFQVMGVFFMMGFRRTFELILVDFSSVLNGVGNLEVFAARSH